MKRPLTIASQFSRALVLTATLMATSLVAAHSLPAQAQDAPAQPAPPASTAPGGPTAAPAAGPVDPAAAAAAVELLEVIGAAKNFDNMLAMLKKHVTSAAGDGPAAKETAEAFDKLINQFGTYKKQMTDETAALYATKFSASELKAVAEFYRSGPGTKFIAEMPELMEQAGGIGQKYAVQMMKDLKEAKDKK
ncbi:MAG: DUF2059 domain-containing protein [Hyphomicrobium sp.]